jgi:hypothetical protein
MKHTTRRAQINSWLKSQELLSKLPCSWTRARKLNPKIRFIFYPDVKQKWSKELEPTKYSEEEEKTGGIGIIVCDKEISPSPDTTISVNSYFPMGANQDRPIPTQLAISVGTYLEVLDEAPIILKIQSTSSTSIMSKTNTSWTIEKCTTSITIPTSQKALSLSTRYSWAINSTSNNMMTIDKGEICIIQPQSIVLSQSKSFVISIIQSSNRKRGAIPETGIELKRKKIKTQSSVAGLQTNHEYQIMKWANDVAMTLKKSVINVKDQNNVRVPSEGSSNLFKGRNTRAATEKQS